ncbi:MAG: DUF2851 family protein [Thermomicrobiales bacterium]
MPRMPSSNLFPEIALCAAWRDGALGMTLRTIDGRPVEVVHRGIWSHGFGPDFREAMVVLDGRELRTGGIEVHHRTVGWAQHGHDGDPRYDDVVLHVVHTHDGAETRCYSGAVVPVVEIGPLLPRPIDPAATVGADWSRFGGDACAPDIARAAPTALTAILVRLGDVRLAEKAALVEADLTALPPAEVLWRGVAVALGFHANQGPMLRLAETLTAHAVESALASVLAGEDGSGHHEVALGLILGTAGFLPLSPAEAGLAGLEPAEVARVEAAWLGRGAPWHGDRLPATAWTRARVRPANHPVARLVALAALVTRGMGGGGLTAALLDPLRAGEDPIAAVRSLTAWPGTGRPRLGEERAAAVVANVVLPFALAVAAQTGDGPLLDAAARAWDRLPAAEANATVRRAAAPVAGETPLRRLGTRGQQGLIHLDHAYCAPRRCYECPIAHLVLAAGEGDAGMDDTA